MTKYEEMKMELLAMVDEYSLALEGTDYENDHKTFVDEFFHHFGEEGIPAMKQNVEDEEKFQEYKNGLCIEGKYSRGNLSDKDLSALNCAVMLSWVIAKYLTPLSLKMRDINTKSKPSLDQIVQMCIDEEKHEAEMSDEDLKAYLACIVAECDINYTKFKLGIM